MIEHPVREGDLLWSPSSEMVRASVMQRYIDWLAHMRDLRFDDYHTLWQWSITDLSAFWQSIWDFFDVQATTSPQAVLADASMPGAVWFPGATLNYAAHAFRYADAERPAIIFQSEGGSLQTMTWADMQRQVGAVAAGLRALGVRRGDRVAAVLPNAPQAVIAFLACASLGAIWSSCSPDMGVASVADRFRQIEPRVLIAVDGYRYGGRAFDRRAALTELRAALPGVERVVLVPYLDPGAQEADSILWDELLNYDAPLQFEPVPFDHPLWILYSSGTTGLPKPIVQGHGGILLEHLKSLALHLDLRPQDRFFWFTTTGWMMWNFLVSGLLMGSTLLLYDGSPAWPDMNALWRFAADTGMTLFGTSAAYLTACRKAGITPGESFDLTRLRAMGSTGSPLPVEGFHWVYQRVKRDLWLVSLSGGTDVCTAFVGGCPLLPVTAGEIQCRCLGARVEVFDEQGRSIVGDVGELVITAPLPSMPLFFWGDADGSRYRSSYFEVYPGVWRHGDWVKLTERGTLVIYGRSDSTINRHGVRMGTSEMYRAVEGVAEVRDSLVIDLEHPDGTARMYLFVVLESGVALDDTLKERIRTHIRNVLSPRHVPDDIIAIPDVPRTLNGKKLEVPIKKILRGVPPEKAVNRDAMANPETLDAFVELAAHLQR
ncbi:acetoacetate--CoA ligase [Roseiflexus castenholzii]|uniref:acetoacetate--CoA ligase n=1 Tax=Roseiflexus castenholzii TaxID=120962 RepID=UPI003C7E0D24